MTWCPFHAIFTGRQHVCWRIYETALGAKAGKPGKPGETP